MLLFGRASKSRDKPKNVTAGSTYSFFLGGSTAGKVVNEHSAMQMTAVYSCVRILAEAVAGLPFHLYRYKPDNGKEIIEVQEAVLALHKAKQQHSISTEEYNQKVNEYSQQMMALEDRQVQLRTAETRYIEVKVWLDTFEEHIKSGDIMSTDDGTILKALVEQIIVNDDGIEINFKCGVVTEKEYV